MKTVMQKQTGPTSRLWSCIGVLLILAGWQIAAMYLGPMLMASPLDTFKNLVPMLTSTHFLDNASVSLWRIGVGVGCGCFIGFILGVLAGHNACLRGLLEPLRWVLMAMPPVVVVMLSMLWFGLGSPMVIFMTVLMMAPGMYVNTVKGMLQVDRNLVEMTHVYRFGRWRKLLHLYLPALTAPLTAALLIAACGGVRMVVMAEVLGAESGVGYALANAQSVFDNTEIFTWIILVLLLVAVIEFVLLQPLQRRMRQWQENDHV